MKEKNPLLTIIIPSYNGVSFMRQCFHSLINDRTKNEKVFDFVEIIFINDGSTDDTKNMSKKLSAEYNRFLGKDVVSIINKKNGQYGSVINRGIQEAKGKYFKVLDVDDTFDVKYFIELVYVIKGFNNYPDVIFTDHTFEKIGTNNQVIQTIRSYFTPYTITNIKDTKFPSDLITMHSIFYKTSILKENNYKQIENIFYSDSQYSLFPLLNCKTMYYLNIPLYRYYIGREEQSINIKMMVKNQEHQLKVMEEIMNKIDLPNIECKSLKRYSLLVIRRMIQWRILIIISDKNLRNKRKAIFDTFKFVKETMTNNYNTLLSGSFFTFVRLSRGFLIGPIIRVGIKAYSKFKKNIMADWD